MALRPERDATVRQNRTHRLGQPRPRAVRPLRVMSSIPLSEPLTGLVRLGNRMVVETIGVSSGLGVLHGLATPV